MTAPLQNPLPVSGRKSELLMPAGSLAKLKIAVLYGADAIYLGTPDLSLRTKSEFTLEEVVEGIEFAHQHGKRVYLTLNLFSHNKDIDKLRQHGAQSSTGWINCRRSRRFYVCKRTRP